MEAFDPAELPELLKLYYRRLFPYAQYYRWLNYGGGDGGGERVLVGRGGNVTGFGERPVACPDVVPRHHLEPPHHHL